MRSAIPQSLTECGEWPEDERIIKRTEVQSPLTDAFSAITVDGIDLGDFPNIRSAEAAILNKSSRGMVIDRIFNREIPIPRTRKRVRNPSKRPLKVLAWGETKNAAEWSRDPRCAVNLVTLHARLRVTNPKWKPEDAISKPAKSIYVPELMEIRSKLYRAFNRTQTLDEWAKDPRCEVGYSALAQRVRAGIPVAKAMKSVRKPNR